MPALATSLPDPAPVLLALDSATERLHIALSLGADEGARTRSLAGRFVMSGAPDLYLAWGLRQTS